MSTPQQESKKETFQEINVESLYTRYGPMVMRRCRFLLKNEQAAFDTMQEVFLNVLKNKTKLTATHPSSLLYRIATNICINKIRNDHSHDTKHYFDIFLNTSFLDGQEETTSAEYLLELVLGKEKSTTRSIAIMYFLNGMTIQEVANTLKMSSAGVHKHLKKLKRRIREKGEGS